MAATFRVTSSQIVRTAAERRLPSTDSVLTMLKWVERHLNRRKPREHNSDRRSRNNSGIKMEMSIPDLRRSPSPSPSADRYGKRQERPCTMPVNLV